MDWYSNNCCNNIYLRSYRWNSQSKGMWRLTLLEETKLESIKGGEAMTISGPIINAVVAVIKVLQDAGYSLGSGIRRISEGNICPLE